MPPLGDGVFIHQRHHAIIPIIEHAPHLVAHAAEFGLDAAAISAMNLDPFQERDREVLIIAAGMNGWARARLHRGEIHCEMWGPWSIAPAIAEKLFAHFDAGPFTQFFLNNLRHRAGISGIVEQIRAKSDKEMVSMAQERELTSGLDWNTQVARSRRIRLKREINHDDETTRLGEDD